MSSDCVTVQTVIN